MRYTHYIITLCLGLTLLIPSLAHAMPPDAFKPVTAVVTVKDEKGQPMEGFFVHAVCHEYGFCEGGEVRTDKQGKVSINVMNGTWDFIATPSWENMCTQPKNTGYVLADLNKSLDGNQRNIEINLAPTIKVNLNFSCDTVDFRAADSRIGFVCKPYGCFFSQEGIGFTSTGRFGIYTNLDKIPGTVYIHSNREKKESLFYIQDIPSLEDSLNISITPENSSLIYPQALDPNGNRVYNGTCVFDCVNGIQTQNISSASKGLNIPLSSSGIRISPGKYIFRSAIPFDSYYMDPGLTFIEAKVGVPQTIKYGGQIHFDGVRITPRYSPEHGNQYSAPEGTTQLKLCFSDSFGHQLSEVYCPKGRCYPTASVSNQGQIYNFEEWSILFFCTTLKKGFLRENNPKYFASWDFGPWGKGETEGNVFGTEEDMRSIVETPSVVLQSPDVPHANDEKYALLLHERLAKAAEESIGVPVDYKLGVIRPSGGGNLEDEMQHGYVSSIRYEYSISPESNMPGWFYDHEFGHGRTLKGPTWFSAFEYYGEAYATLIGAKSRSMITGGELLLRSGIARDIFVKNLHNPRDTKNFGDSIDMMQFVTNYINYAHGWTPHQRMITEWGDINNPQNAFKPIRNALLMAKFNDLEEFATIYSWLCNDNLAPLFNATGCFPVKEEKINHGLSIIRSIYENLATPELSLGSNVVNAGSSSIAVNSAASSKHPLTSTEFTLVYDPTKVQITDVMRRDLSLIENWQITSTPVPDQARVRIMLHGDKPLSGIGSIAHIRFKLLPGAAGTLPFRLTDISTNAGALPEVTGSIPLPNTPIHTTITLPDAVAGVPYTTTLGAVAGTPPYTWTVVEDALPPGLTLNPATGAITGTCTTAKKYLFRVRVQDSKAMVHHRWFVLQVVAT